MAANLTGKQEDILRTASVKAEELKGYVENVFRDADQHVLAKRDIRLFNSHIDAALQYLRSSFEELPESFRRSKETEGG